LPEARIIQSLPTGREKVAAKLIRTHSIEEIIQEPGLVIVE
jgi:hypothetical protein